MVDGLSEASHQPASGVAEADITEVLDHLAGDPSFAILAYANLLALAFVVGGLGIRRLAGGRRHDRGSVNVGCFRRLDLIGVGWVFALYAWLSLAQSAVPAGMEQGRAIGRLDLFVSIAFQGFMTAMVLGVMLPKASPVDWLGLRWPRWRSVLVLAPGSVVAMWMVFAALELSGFMRWLHGLGVDPVQDAVRALQDQSDPGFLALMRFSALIVAPICEEIVFRGYVYGVLKRFGGPWVAAVASSLVFAAAHASAGALLPLALFGLLLVWMYERTGSIWAPIAAHACFNAVTVVVLMVQA